MHGRSRVGIEGGCYCESKGGGGGDAFARRMMEDTEWQLVVPSRQPCRAGSEREPKLEMVSSVEHQDHPHVNEAMRDGGDEHYRRPIDGVHMRTFPRGPPRVLALCWGWWHNPRAQARSHTAVTRPGKDTQKNKFVYGPHDLRAQSRAQSCSSSTTSDSVDKRLFPESFFRTPPPKGYEKRSRRERRDVQVDIKYDYTFGIVSRGITRSRYFVSRFADLCQRRHNTPKVLFQIAATCHIVAQRGAGALCEPCTPRCRVALCRILQGHAQGRSQAVTGRKKRRTSRELYSSRRQSRLTGIAEINTQIARYFHVLEGLVASEVHLQLTYLTTGYMFVCNLCLNNARK